MEPLSIKITKNGIESFKENINPMTNQVKETSLGFMNIGDIKEKIKKNPLRMVITKIEDINLENGSFIKLGVDELNFLPSPETQNPKPTFEGQKLLVFGEETKPWRAFNQLIIFTAKWLYDTGKLKCHNMPVFVPRGKRYLLNSTPFHNYIGDDGKPQPYFGIPQEIAKGIWLNTNFDSVGCKESAEYLMKSFAPEISFKILGFDKK